MFVACVNSISYLFPFDKILRKISVIKMPVILSKDDGCLYIYVTVSVRSITSEEKFKQL